MSRSTNTCDYHSLWHDCNDFTSSKQLPKPSSTLPNAVL